jgi:hypothetical protein
MDPKYGALEGKPVRFTDTEAWVFNGAWYQNNPAEVLTGAAVLDAKQFQKDFGSLPPLPKSAFQSGPNSSSTLP